ncbi:MULTISPECIES: DUF3465 domain-containing protein [unclassified Thalassotalea]|uniref:DUF3465 domain-containing protein n=1 Tax=unclassified Thalassotalea TaxID=2614972 RepID=UPI00107FEFFE|nr:MULTISPECIES: DUF3465 domain-containing protein [unclassified Thalassotalea]NMP15787.1 DUF3465 domain-containing protein [Thalassotalea sp. Y01]QBY04834.1 DUF3465 domain-containing protein [Thalassotalea sp. HSM 43]
MKHILIAFVLFVAGITFLEVQSKTNAEPVAADVKPTNDIETLERAFSSSNYQESINLDDFSDLEKISYAFDNGLSDIQVRGFGEVTKVLADDNDGSRHQRFIVRLQNKHTLLIAHNIDLAKRINTLRQGDEIEFYGEYEWNDKGGVVHWTHKDPRNKHEHGYLRHSGLKYW